MNRNLRETGERPSPVQEFSAQRPLRLAYFVSHPIQYQAPLLRRIAEESDIDLTVYFSSDISLKQYVDPGFGVSVKWDVPLLEGYKHEFLPVLIDTEQLRPWNPMNYGIRRLLRMRGCDTVWIHGYSTLTNLQAVLVARSTNKPVLVRSDSHLRDRTRSRQTLAAKRIFFTWLKKRVTAALAVGESNSAYWHHYFGKEFPVFLVPTQWITHFSNGNAARLQ